MADIIGREGFRLSQNDYDWLGDGVYFFQDGSLRAWQWARERHGDDAAVIGADIRLVNCMDLLDVGWNEVLSDAYDRYLASLKKTGQMIPTQYGGAHQLDREVINYAVGVTKGSRNSNRLCASCLSRRSSRLYRVGVLQPLSRTNSRSRAGVLHSPNLAGE